MSDFNELKRLAEACKDLLPLRYMQSSGGSLSVRNDHGIVFGVHQNRSFPAMRKANKAYADLALAANPAAVLGLIAENKELADEVVVVEFQKKILGEGLRKDRAEIAQLKAERDQLFGQTEQLKAEVEALRKLASATVADLQKAVAWICREVEAGTTSATHWAIRLGNNAKALDAAVGKGEQP